MTIWVVCQNVRNAWPLAFPAMNEPMNEYEFLGHDIWFIFQQS